MGTAQKDAVLLVRQLTGAPLSLSLPPSSTVSQLKKLVERKAAVPVDSQRIVFSGRELDSEKPLSFYGVAAGAEHQMTLVLKTKGMRVLVKTLKECTFVIDCDATSTVFELKHKVAEQDAQWDVQRQRIILHGKELEDSSRLSDCGLVVGLDEEAPTVHLVMRLPAPGTARRKRDPVLAQKDGTGGVCTPKVQGLKVKTEPIEDDDLKAMSLVGQLSDMLVDGDQMEFEQAWQEYEQQTAVPPVWDVEAGLGPRSPTKAPTPAIMCHDTKLMDATDVNSFLAPCPTGPSATSPKAGDTVLVAEAVLVHEDKPTRPVDMTSAPLTADAAASAAEPSGAVKAAIAVDIDGCSDDGQMVGAVPSTQGRAYDLSKVDEKLRKRLLKNRLSAERSRQRKQAHVEALEFELSCCRSENEHLKKRVATLEAQVASLSLQSGLHQSGCKPDWSVSHQELTAVS